MSDTLRHSVSFPSYLSPYLSRHTHTNTPGLELELPNSSPCRQSPQVLPCCSSLKNQCLPLILCLFFYPAFCSKLLKKIFSQNHVEEVIKLLYCFMLSGTIHLESSIRGKLANINNILLYCLKWPLLYLTLKRTLRVRCL